MTLGCGGGASTGCHVGTEPGERVLWDPKIDVSQEVSLEGTSHCAAPRGRGDEPTQR